MNWYLAFIIMSVDQAANFLQNVLLDCSFSSWIYFKLQSLIFEKKSVSDSHHNTITLSIKATTTGPRKRDFGMNSVHAASRRRSRPVDKANRALSFRDRCVTFLFARVFSIAYCSFVRIVGTFVEFYRTRTLYTRCVRRQ